MYWMKPPVETLPIHTWIAIYDGQSYSTKALLQEHCWQTTKRYHHSKRTGTGRLNENLMKSCVLNHSPENQLFFFPHSFLIFTSPTLTKVTKVPFTSWEGTYWNNIKGQVPALTCIFKIYIYIYWWGKEGGRGDEGCVVLKWGLGINNLATHVESCNLSMKLANG